MLPVEVCVYPAAAAAAGLCPLQVLAAMNSNQMSFLCVWLWIKNAAIISSSEEEKTPQKVIYICYDFSSSR